MRQVRCGVVEDVAIASSGRDGDDHCDHHPETDRREDRARPGLVAGKVAKGEANRDGGSSTESANERQTARSEEDHRRDENHEPEYEFGRSGVAGAMAVPPAYARRKNAIRTNPIPGSAERWTRLGVAGRPERDAAIESFRSARAGNEAAT